MTSQPKMKQNNKNKLINKTHTTNYKNIFFVNIKIKINKY